jgi:hypothetical protein
MSSSQSENIKIKELIIKSKGILKEGTIKGENVFTSETFLQRNIQSLPPEEAYLMINNEEDIISFNTDSKKRIRRIFFFNNTEWTEFEKSEISKFISFAKRKEADEKNNKYSIKSIVDTLPEETILRFIQAAKFDYEKGEEFIFNYLSWRKLYFPFELTSPVIEILDSGFLYTFGRDKRFRPICILNTEVYLKLQSKYSSGDWLRAVVYFLEYLIHHMLIPGQVEDWCVISDLRSVSLFSFPSDIKTFIKVMQDNYRGRLKTNFIIGMNILTRGLWGIAKAMIDPETNKKIKILGYSDFDEIFELINRDQVEKKFEGEEEDLKKDFFPPSLPKAKKCYGEDVKFYTKEKYFERINNNKVFTPSPYLKENINDKNISKVNVNTYEDVELNEECFNELNQIENMKI